MAAAGSSALCETRVMDFEAQPNYGIEGQPNYGIASEEPLLLDACRFPPGLLRLDPPLAAHARTDATVEALCAALLSRAALLTHVRQVLYRRPVVLPDLPSSSAAAAADSPSNLLPSAATAAVPFCAVDAADMRATVPGGRRAGAIQFARGCSPPPAPAGGAAAGGGEAAVAGRKRRIEDGGAAKEAAS